MLHSSTRRVLGTGGGLLRVPSPRRALCPVRQQEVLVSQGPKTQFERHLLRAYPVRGLREQCSPHQVRPTFEKSPLLHLLRSRQRARANGPAQAGYQVWSIIQLYPVDFSQSRISVKRRFQQTHNIRFLAANFDRVLGPMRLERYT